MVLKVGEVVVVLLLNCDGMFWTFVFICVVADAGL